MRASPLVEASSAIWRTRATVEGPTSGSQHHSRYGSVGVLAGRRTPPSGAAFRARGLPGFLYWKLLEPVHRVAFAQMVRRRVRAMSGARWRTPARRVPTWPQG
jgi:hypothetical protein